MKLKNIFIIAAFFVITPFLFSQTASDKGLSIENRRVERQGELLSVSMDIVIDDLNVRSNDMIMLSPVLISNSGEAELELSPIAVLGKKRSKVVQRAIRLNNDTGFDVDPYDIVKRKNNTSQRIAYSTNFPMKEWMRDADRKSVV